jgi:hypothetical protein
VLGAHASPKDVVVGELSPVARDLDGLAKAEWVEEREHLERDLPREECERVEPDELVRLGREHRELTRKGRAARSSATETYWGKTATWTDLRKAAHGEKALEDDLAPRMARGREGRPDAVDRLPVCQGEGIKRLESARGCFSSAGACKRLCARVTSTKGSRSQPARPTGRRQVRWHAGPCSCELGGRWSSDRPSRQTWPTDDAASCKGRLHEDSPLGAGR